MMHVVHNMGEREERRGGERERERERRMDEKEIVNF